MDKPIVLDICCRMGGATVGYQRAGYYVIGIDKEPQPGYPGDEFWQADGLKVLADLLSPYGTYSLGLIHRRPALIHQSWPCQAANTATASNRARGLTDAHYQFIPEARELSDRIGIPYVIEQPTSSVKGTIRQDITLCMDMFKGELPPPWVQKHRSFELGCWPAMARMDTMGFAPRHPEGPVRGPSVYPFQRPAGHTGYVRGHRHGVVRSGAEAPYIAAYGKGGGKGTTDEIAHAMGIDWMTDRFDLCEAIPPAYTEWLGRQFLSISGCA